MLKFLIGFIKVFLVIADLGLVFLSIKLIKDGEHYASEPGLVIFSYVLLLNLILLIFT